MESWNDDEVYKLINDKLRVDVSWISSFSKIQSEFDNALTIVIETAKFIAYGQEVAFAYFWSKLKTTEIARSIMVWKLNDLNKEDITNNLKKIWHEI